MPALTRKAVFQAVREKLTTAKSRAALSQKLGKRWTHAGTVEIARAIGLQVAPQKAPRAGAARAKATSKRFGVAKSFAAQQHADRLGQDNEVKKAQIKGRILRSINREVRATEKVKGSKLSQDEKRKIAVKAIKSEVDAIKAGKAEQKPKRGKPQPKLTREQRWEQLASIKVIDQKSSDLYQAGLKAMSPEDRRSYFKWKQEQSNKAHRSRAAKKGAQTRKQKQEREQSRTTSLNATEEGKRLLEAEKKFSKTTRGNAILDPKKFDQYLDEKHVAEGMVKVRQAFDKPSPAQIAHNDSQPDIDLNSGSDPTEAWRVKGFNKVVSGNRMMEGEATGIPWKVTWVDGKERVIAGAKMGNDQSWDHHRWIELHDTQGQHLRLHFPKGDYEVSRRARRLIREIGSGKAQTMSLDAMEALVKSDRDYQQHIEDKAARERHYQEKALALKKFLADKNLTEEDLAKKHPTAQWAYYKKFLDEFDQQQAGKPKD